MPAEPIVVGVDVATRDVRVRCVDAAGSVVASGAAALPAPEAPAPGRAEQDARSWWPAACAALREATAALGAGRERIRALSVAATSWTIVLVDVAGEPVAPALMYHDARAGDEARRAQEAGADRWDALGLRISGSWSLAKLGWLARRPEAAAAARACHTPDLLGWRLTGAPPPTDWSHALKSGYDARRGEWAWEALEALGLDPGLLPEVLPPTTPVGTVTLEAAELTGLPAGCEVRLGMTDGCAGQLACGASEPGRCVSVLGTTLVVKGVSRALVRDPTGAVYCHRHPDGPWLPGGASNTGGEALRHLDPERLAALDAAAAARGPASVASYPLRRDGERFPFVAPGARGFTLGTPEDEVDAHRALLEGVAFCERLGFEHLQRLGAPRVPPTASAGGGSRSPVWSTIRATVLGHAIELVATADTAFGASLLAAAGSVHPDLATASSAMVRPGRLVEPDPAESEALDARYAEWVGALEERGWLDRVPAAPG